MNINCIFDNCVTFDIVHIEHTEQIATIFLSLFSM